MKRFKILITAFISILSANDFTISDPPMIYIYHFVSYDTTSILLHGGERNDTKSKVLRFPLFNKNDMKFGSYFSRQGDNLVLGKPLDPKLVSAMVTSAVARNPHVHIAGESIQDRIKTDNFISIVKSYEYPKRTDFIFLGEINTLASQYEVDIKLIDVSTQKIIASESFVLEFDSMKNLRSKINSLVDPLMGKIIAPFIGSVYLRVDSTSRHKIRWDDISIRPLKSYVGTRNLDTKNSDYSPYLTMPMPNKFLNSHGDILSPFNASDYKLIKSFEDINTFLAGNYRIKAFLKNNEDPFVKDFIVKAGDLNEIHMILPTKDTDGDGIMDDFDACPSVPGFPNEDSEMHGCPIAESVGDITILNIWDGVGLEILSVNDSSDTLIAWGSNKNNQIEFNSAPYQHLINSENNSVTIFDLPLGKYLRNSFSNTEERFPAKQYVNLFADSDSIFLKVGDVDIKTSISDRDIINGKEVIIYFDPFTPSLNHKYRLYIDQSLFAVTSVLGELHIIGMPYSYEGNIRAVRKGYKDAIVKIHPGNKKSYHIADLTVPIKNSEIKQPLNLPESILAFFSRVQSLFN